MAASLDYNGGPAAVLDSIWNLLAFASRYGHQQVESLLDWFEEDLAQYCRALANLIEQENSTLGNDPAGG